jgi:dTDP-4-dehydrorhamnose reductase
MSNIWITGNKGMLGTELSLLFEKNGISYIGSDFEVDITDLSALNNFSNERNINWIINCAAYTAVDKAEDEQETCRCLNTLGAANIAACAKDIGARIIHISTDYVFDGKGNKPYKEDNNTNPIGVYGLTKRDGEQAVLKKNPDSYILRTAWLYGKYGNNFVHTLLRLFNERDEIKVVDDQFGSPTWAFDLSSAILKLINAVESCKDIPFGIYNYTNEGKTTWYNFTQEIFSQSRINNIVKKNCQIKPCSTAEYPTKAVRPAYSVLDKAKIKNVLGINIPVWNDSLRNYLQTYA